MRLLHYVLILWILCLTVTISLAQDDETLPAVGDVPLASKIQVTQDEDDPTIAIISGDDGAVFPNAVVVVQNRYTADREITTSTINGAFTTRLYGQKQTPYWIAAFQNFPSDEVIDEAMGATVYGDGEDNTFYVEVDLGGNVPRYRVFGEKRDNGISLDVELDVANGFPTVDNLEMKIELRQVPEAIGIDSVAVSSEDLQYDDNQIRFPVDITYENNRFSNVLYFTGYVRSGDGDWQRWEDSVLFGVSNDNIASYSFLSRDTPNEVLLTYQLGMNEPYRINSTIIDKYVVLPPGNYMLEPTFTIESFVRQSVHGELTYEITRPSGDIDVINGQIIQVNSPLDNSFFQLMTDNDLLKSYPFDEYGDYVIHLHKDIMFDGGERLSQESDYWIRIAEKLHLSPTILSGTPLVNDNLVSIGAHVIPPLPADVTVEVLTQHGVMELTGQANESGYFVDENLLADDVRRITYSATYEDALGRLWSSEDLQMSTNIVHPDLDLLYGKRGLAGYDGQQQAWFNTSVYPDDDRTVGRQPYFPYYAGDVAYVPDATDGGIVVGRVFSEATVVSPHGILLDRFWDNDGLTGDSTFDRQLGMGVDGIREGDYAFLFGYQNESILGIYGALMIVEDEDEPARVLSPFMAKLTVFGQAVDMFFVPTVIRPAQVLEQGDILSIVGQVAPTLPAEVTVTVTAPSGDLTRFADVANPIGYFYSAQNDTPLDEIGVWNIDIYMTYRGETSAGQLESPYPEGNLNYDIYVVPPDNPPLGEAEFMTGTRKVTQTYALQIPEGWTNVRAFATLTTPSWILDQQELTVFPAGTSYTYNPTQLAQRYPNVELLETAEGDHVADVVTLTLVMTGIDTNGDPVIRTRSYTILHDMTYTYDEAVIRD